MKTKLTIESNDPDICGSWRKDDVEAEMREIGMCVGAADDWIEYILSHFDFSDDIINAIANEDVLTMAFRFDGDVVYVTKK